MVAVNGQPNFTFPEGGVHEFKSKIVDTVRDILEEWTGQKLQLTSIYGIRIYQEGAILAPHVDRAPLISSAIINVDQDVDEPWPLEVIGRDGIAKNVTMKPGEIVLYVQSSKKHDGPAQLSTQPILFPSFFL
jgi:prolyl 4-hydroxylase